MIKMIKGNVYTLTIAILGAVKLVTESFGVKLIEDTQIDDIANGIASILAVAGIAISHFHSATPATPVAPVTPEQPKA